MFLRRRLASLAAGVGAVAASALAYDAHCISLVLDDETVSGLKKSLISATETAASTNRQMILKKRPGNISPSSEHLEMVEVPKPAVQGGKALVRNLYASIDPTHRIWMSDADQYLAPSNLGEPMRAITLGVVEESSDPGLAVGSHVVGLGNMQDYYVTSVAEGAAVVQEVPGLPMTAWLNELSLVIGLTAWVGTLDICKPKVGETFVVSAAAGAVGSMAGQLAKLEGARVVGIVGSAAKGKWLVEEVGFDAYVNYKEADLVGQLRAAAPNGVDSYFDNVGGVSTESVLQVANNNARVALCGVISGYNSGDMGLPNYQMLLHRRVALQGFICLDHAAQMPAVVPKLIEHSLAGKMKVKLDVQEGLENYVATVNRLFDGSNTGKLVLKL